MQDAQEMTAEELRLEIAYLKGWQWWKLAETAQYALSNNKVSTAMWRVVPAKEVPMEEYWIKVWLEKIPQWDNSIAAAWELVEEMRGERAYLLRLTNGGNAYACWFGSGITGPDAYYGFAETAPLAICHAYVAWKRGK